MPKRQSSEKAVENVAKKAKPGGHWSLGLVSAVDDPDLFVKSDDVVNVIKDKYAKAEFHYLILPKEHLTSLKSVTRSHCDLLKHMENMAKSLAGEQQHEGRKFKIGYHSEASMSQLHLHVISDDMNSDWLKTKKHWNSFTTDFFLNSEDVRKSLEENGKVELLSKDVCKKFMESPLKCHKCDFKPKHMPDLKRHIKTHL